MISAQQESTVVNWDGGVEREHESEREPAVTGASTAAEERPVWSGTPSQWTNFLPFLFCTALGIASIVVANNTAEPLWWIGVGLAVIIAFIYWVRVATTRINVTTERIGTATGVFTRRRRDMELYRVKDTTLHEPFFLRLVGLANIEVNSSDKSTPFLVLPAIRDAEALRQQLRAHVERMRMNRRVREIDFE
jgi:uncharacterized membrane protein YdbT with pleckstrin-like domain